MGGFIAGAIQFAGTLLTAGGVAAAAARFGATGGSGSHRLNDDTTWEWSDNPALCVADYLVTVMDVDP